MGRFESFGEDDVRIEKGQRLIRLADTEQPLSHRIATRLHHLLWRTPFHNQRLTGEFPLRLLALPADPLPGDAVLGAAMIEGFIRHGQASIAISEIDFGALQGPSRLIDYLQSFFWLRDLDATGCEDEATEAAQRLMRAWLGDHGARVDKHGWRPDHWGWRMLLCASHSRLILSSSDLVYRSAVLNLLARGARHLDRSADRAPSGIARAAAWAGVVAAGLIVQGGETRVAKGESGLARALATALSGDGGTISRSPSTQLALVELLAMLRAVYAASDRAPPDFLNATLDRAASALLDVTLGDGGLSSWQGCVPVTAETVQPVLRAAGPSPSLPIQTRDWGYQRVRAGSTIVIIDAAPPPAGSSQSRGCASTLAFEMSDGRHRLIVSCGGANAPGLPDAFAQKLRTTAAHSTLTVADSNSTALNEDGTLGRGVGTVDIAHLENGGIEARHDGYAVGRGFIHERRLELSADGRELAGEDALLPTKGVGPGVAGFVARFHLAPGVDVTPTADRAGALLRVAGGPSWHFRCRDAACEIDDSVWIDANGVPRSTLQLVISGEASPRGSRLGWLFRRAG